MTFPRIFITGLALATGLSIIGCSSMPSGDLSEALLLSRLNQPIQVEETIDPTTIGESYESIFAQRYPGIVKEAPPAGLPQRITTAPVRAGRALFKAADATPQTAAEHKVQHSQMFRKFYEAADSPDAVTAEKRWEDFITDHTLPTGEFECPTDAKLCEWAEQELVRARYIKAGRITEAKRVEAAVPVAN